MDNYRCFILLVGIVLSVPIFYKLDDLLQYKLKKASLSRKSIILNAKGFVFNSVTVVLLFLCFVEVASSSYSPFIYFRF